MSAQTAALEAATIGQQCKVLHCRRSRRSARNSPNRHCANGAHIWASSKRCCRRVGTRTATGGAAHPRSASAADEAAGGVRFRAMSEDLAAADPRTRRGRLYRAGGADHLHRRQRHRQNPSTHWIGGGGLPAEAPGAIRYGRSADQ